MSATLDVEGLGHTTNEAFTDAKKLADELTRGHGDWIVTNEEYGSAAFSDRPVVCKMRLERIEVSS